MAATDISDTFEHQKVQDSFTNILLAFSALETLVNGLRSQYLNGVFGPANFEIVSNFDIQNGDAFNYMNAGIAKTLATDQAFNTGTAQIITADKWSSALLTLSSAAACTVTWSATLNAATEAAAILALPAVPAGHTVLGYVTVQTGSGVTWTAGTDALEGGTGGTVSLDTNYYNVANPNAAVVGAAFSAATYLEA